MVHMAIVVRIIFILHHGYAAKLKEHGAGGGVISTSTIDSTGDISINTHKQMGILCKKTKPKIVPRPSIPEVPTPTSSNRERSASKYIDGEVSISAGEIEGMEDAKPADYKGIKICVILRCQTGLRRRKWSLTCNSHSHSKPCKIRVKGTCTFTRYKSYNSGSLGGNENEWWRTNFRLISAEKEGGEKLEVEEEVDDSED
eukprot:gnl/MRDRNA2_/MRDRNA2_36087_c0_seq1.p1 gnl/MRDRNA2_/MRDRNA2_36087_c0~~gnl/MRDRNA2_/MRDRNA2_36087_c0_seq1.p1  ORF type:complete len:200 (+),score=18.16 gnl/MRDRNA2_/MRDRNA2_36087_c0_seq1:76-675(+)